MANIKTRKFGGDIRMWLRGSTPGQFTPVIPEPADPQGNQPIEANVLTFAYDRPDPTNITSKRRGNRYGQIIKSDQDPGTSSATVQLLEVPDIILPRLLHGLGVISDVAGGSVSGAAFVLPSTLALPMELPHKLLAADPAPVVKNQADDKTYAAGTDYTIDLRQGLLVIPVGSDIITDNETQLLLSYTYGAYQQTVIAGGGSPTQPYYITGDMEDRESGESGRLVIPHIDLGVADDVDWLSDTIIQPNLTGAIIIADGFSEPYKFTQYAAAA